MSHFYLQSTSKFAFMPSGTWNHPLLSGRWFVLFPTSRIFYVLFCCCYFSYRYIRWLTTFLNDTKYTILTSTISRRLLHGVMNHEVFRSMFCYSHEIKKLVVYKSFSLNSVKWTNKLSRVLGDISLVNYALKNIDFLCSQDHTDALLIRTPSSTPYLRFLNTLCICKFLMLSENYFSKCFSKNNNLFSLATNFYWKDYINSCFKSDLIHLALR